MDVRLPDGTILRNVPEGTTKAEIQRRVELAAKKYEEAQAATRAEHQQRAMISASRAESPVLSKVADFATGASSMMRGAANLASRPFTGEGEAGLGDKIWPEAAGSEDSGFRMAGEFLDPVAWTVFGKAAKALPYMKVTGGGIKRAAKAIPRNAASGAAAGGVVGGLSDHGDAKTGAIIGGAATSLLPPVVGAIGKVSRWGVNRFSGRGVGPEILRDAAGADYAAIEAAARNAPPGLTGTQAVAAVESDAINALGSLSKTSDRASYFSRKARGQQADRVKALEAVTPDKQAAIDARSAAADPLYAAARSAGDVVNTRPVIAQINDLLKRQGSNKPLAAALTALKKSLLEKVKIPVLRNGQPALDSSGTPVMREVVRPIRNSERVASAMDGLKTAMDKQANPQNAHILKELVGLKQALAKAIPGYERADAVFAKLSAPVNQAVVLEKAAEKLVGTGGTEGARPFLNILGQGEEALLKKSTGQPRFKSLSDVLTPQQMSAVNRVAAELERDLSINRGAVAGQGGAAGIIKDHLGRFVLPNWISGEIAVTNRLLSFLEGRVTKITEDQLREAFKTGQGFHELLTKASPADKNVILLAINRIAKSPYLSAWAGGAINATGQEAVSAEAE